LSGTTGFIYVNGIQGATGFLGVPGNVQRTSNYIGKSNWPDRNADAVYDDLKIYNEALAPDLILNDFNQSPSDGLLYLN